jgi:helicase MOV-10
VGVPSGSHALIIYQYIRSLEIENNDEDLLPELIQGDFVWLDDVGTEIRYEALVTRILVFRGRSRGFVLKMWLRLPAQFNPQKEALFTLRFRLNRVTLRRQYHVLTRLSTGKLPRRLLFPSPADIGPIRRLSRAEIDNLDLANGNIRDDDQQLRAVVSILEQPPGSVPFIIFGP